jgi:hypothetical protein
MKMLRVKVPVSQCIDEVLQYISEMEDKKDSWGSVYESLKELKEKVLNKENE